MAEKVTTSFFYGGSSAPEQNTVDQLIDSINEKVQGASEDRSAAQVAAAQAQAYAAQASDAADSASALTQQATEAIDAANSAVADANAAVDAANAAVADAQVLVGQTEAFAQDASNAADQAATSEANAASSADSANAAKVAAQSAQSAAETAKTGAETAKTGAQSAQTAAETAQTAAQGYSSSASSSASTATTQAGIATTQAGIATTQAGIATTKAGDASSSATDAAASASSANTSALSAAASAASAAASLDNFDDRYLGAKASDPTTDNDGNPLVTGALYFNTSSKTMRTYDGTQWIDAVSVSLDTFTVYEYIATAGQTTFTGADKNAEILKYTAGLIEVQINGLVLVPGEDYTASNGTSVVLTSAASVNDEIQISAYNSFKMADSENPVFTGVATFPVILENASIVSSGASGTVNLNAKAYSVLYYTGSATANFTLNIRGDASTSLDATIPTGRVMTVVFLNTNGSTPYYANAVTIDGTSVTPKWQGATAPSAGNTGIDIYTFSIIKTASSTYTVLASLTQFN